MSENSLENLLNIDKEISLDNFKIINMNYNIRTHLPINVIYKIVLSVGHIVETKHPDCFSWPVRRSQDV